MNVKKNCCFRECETIVRKVESMFVWAVVVGMVAEATSLVIHRHSPAAVGNVFMCGSTLKPNMHVIQHCLNKQGTTFFKGRFLSKEDFCPTSWVIVNVLGVPLC